MLNKKMNENDIKTMFTKFGAIEDCMVLRDNDGKSRGERHAHVGTISVCACVCVCAHILVAHSHSPNNSVSATDHTYSGIAFCFVQASCPRFVTRPFDLS
jgi:hypothetical protein